MKILIALTIIVSIISCKSDCETSTNCDQQIVDTGGCEAIYAGYYYNPSTTNCRKYYFGICNEVPPFENLEECQDCDCTE